MDNLKDCICCKNLFLTESKIKIGFICLTCVKEIMDSLAYCIGGKNVSFKDWKWRIER